MVKMREAFRPFAPAIAIEEAAQWFEVEKGTELPYMITIVDVRNEYRSQLPAITHVNGTARLQTVSAKNNCKFPRLCAIGQATGGQIVLIPEPM